MKFEIFLGDIDVFLDRCCYFKLAEALWKSEVPELSGLVLIPTSEYGPRGLDMDGMQPARFTHMPVEEWGEIQRDFATVFQGLLTNVQVGKITK